MGDILRNLKHHKDEDVKKGQAVKNQKALWDKTLEFRFLLQKAFSSSNRLPRDPVRSSFCTSDEEVSAAYSELITASKKTLDSLLELGEALLENNPSIAQSLEGNAGQSSKKLSGDSNLDMEDDEEWLRISQMNRRISAFRDKAVDKWQRKTEVTTGAAAIKSKLQAFNQNISEQVAAYMRDPTRMIKQMQQRRSTIGIFGAVTEVANNANGEEAHPEGDPELLDDSEFYQQLLKEFFETVDPTSSGMLRVQNLSFLLKQNYYCLTTETAFYALKRLQTKKRKIVDRRASKSRKIRYHVHEKIVNFMAPEPMNLPPMAPKLFENLFGLKTQ
ncbi:RRNA processing protein-related isoform 1 [Gossypium australe]|uniref:rRNA processing protein-related isoform 1 n=1 Tax=Gossypium australe TaxID=47621 RepID=A0A5B6U811_9ROSI|nr:RRNA processing protein-related isoform 1 [Gossypium australe]